MIKNGIRENRYIEPFLYMLESLPANSNVGVTFYISSNGQYEKVNFDGITDCYLLKGNESNEPDMLIVEYMDWYIGTRSMAAIKKKDIHRHILYHLDTS